MTFEPPKVITRNNCGCAEREPGDEAMHVQCLVSFSKFSREVVVGGALQEREIVSGQTALGQTC